jgi:transposase InsO family protein
LRKALILAVILSATFSAVTCGRHRIARLMQLGGIVAKMETHFRWTSTKRDDIPTAANLVQWNFHADQQNRVWASDITLLRTGQVRAIPTYFVGRVVEVRLVPVLTCRHGRLKKSYHEKVAIETRGQYVAHRSAALIRAVSRAT